MRGCGLVVAALLYAAGGCAYAHDVAQVEKVTSFRATVRSDLRVREVVYQRPTVQAAGTKAPAIVLLQYLHGTAADMADLTGAARLARDFGVWVIVPDSVQGKWNYGSASVKTVDDVKFLSAVIDDAIARYPIDPKRIYLSGYSNGGLMAERYACEQPQRIAALAVVATTIEPLDAARCKPALGTPILFVNGVQDPIVPFNGNLLKYSAADTLALWRRINGCTDAVTRSSLPDLVDDLTTVRFESYRECADGSAVEQYIVDGGGHTWPGTLRFSLGLGVTTQDINGTDVIWQFLQQFSRP